MPNLEFSIAPLVIMYRRWPSLPASSGLSLRIRASTVAAQVSTMCTAGAMISGVVKCSSARTAANIG